MPSPIAHSAAAYAIYRFRRQGMPQESARRVGSVPTLLLATIALTMLPDLDSIPGFLTGDLSRFHNNWTHSIFVGLVVALIVGVIAASRDRSTFRFWFFTALISYGLHLIMDTVTDGRGTMLLWPFSSDRFSSPVLLFYGLHWSDGLVSIRHLWTALSELAFAAVVVVTAQFIAPRRREEKEQLRIGIMLRAYEEKGGVGVYTRNIVEELIRADRRNHYVLFWRNPENLGRFARYENVTERLVKGRNTAVWDQVSIPYACWREKVDVVFHPKFTAPLLAPCEAVMVVHGADWFIPEQARFYGRWDVRYIRAIMPLYFKKCAAVISVSQGTTDDFERVLRLPPGKLNTVYFAPARQFKRIDDEFRLHKVRAKYGLPERFILTLTKPNGHHRKNFGGVLAAYAMYHQRTPMPHPLVVGGKDCERLRDEYQIPRDGYGGDILFSGWIDQEDLPAVYSMADLYLYPSNLEAFPIPIVEAMACGTPIVTSNANGLKELAGGAALLVDPEDTDAIADAVSRVLSDEDLRATLSTKGLERSREFNWDLCARKTLATLEAAAGHPRSTADDPDARPATSPHVPVGDSRLRSFFWRANKPQA